MERSHHTINVIGHLDHGIEEPLVRGLDEVAHVDEFMDEHLTEEISPRDFKPVQMDFKKIQETVKTAKENDVLVVSNLVTDVISYEYLETGPSHYNDPSYNVIRPSVIENWLGQRMLQWQGQQEWRRNILQPFYKKMTISLHEAGVPLLVGTDTGVEGGLPSNIHRDIQLLVDAGLTSYEALKAATNWSYSSFHLTAEATCPSTILFCLVYPAMLYPTSFSIINIKTLYSKWYRGFVLFIC